MLGFGEVASAVKGVIDKFVPDAKDRLEAENLVMKQLHLINMGQIEVNKEEAKSDSLLVAGWRPATGWGSLIVFMYGAVGANLLTWISQAFGLDIPPLPTIDTAWAFDLLMAMLGFGGLRTFEKLKGVQR